MSFRNPTSLRVADNLRAEMSRRRYTSSDLAAALGVSQTSAHRRMNGHTAIDVDELERLAVWLDVPVTTLLGTAA